MNTTPVRSAPTVLFAVLALAACLWVGWRDFDPFVPQAVVRDAIHAGPRMAMQVLVRFVAPIVLVAFLVRQALAHRAK
jgi:hypothetical protein